MRLVVSCFQILDAALRADCVSVLAGSDAIQIIPNLEMHSADAIQNEER